MCGAFEKPCYLCKFDGRCVCSWNEDEFCLASKDELIDRVNSPKYSEVRGEIITALNVYYSYYGRQIWIVGDNSIICPICKARFSDEIYYMLRNKSELKYCPNCGERIYNEVTQN